MHISALVLILHSAKFCTCSYVYISIELALWVETGMRVPADKLPSFHLLVWWRQMLITHALTLKQKIMFNYLPHYDQHLFLVTMVAAKTCSEATRTVGGVSGRQLVVLSITVNF